MTCQVLERNGQPFLAYQADLPRPGAPTILFLPGYRSDMTGSKVSGLAAYAQQKCLNMVRFDYSGHGQSGGNFRDTAIGDWLRDAVDIIDHVVPAGPVVVVGSSMGGWIALQVALQRPDRVIGLVGVAAAPDFTPQMFAGLNDTQRQELAAQGYIELPPVEAGYDPYYISQKLIDDGAGMLVLGQQHILSIPMILLHGGRDTTVPSAVTGAIERAFPRANILVHLIPDGDHALSRPDDLAVLYRAVETMLSGRLGDFVI